MQLVIQPSSSTGQQQQSTINDCNPKINTNPDPMTGVHMLSQIRTTTLLNDYLSSTARNSLQYPAKSEPLMTLTNSSSASGTFTITNVPSNEDLSFLLNGDTTLSSQTHVMDTKNSLDGAQFKNEAVSPRINHQ
ncbi:unnamed protein product, partial [Rotaria socialis]